MSPYSYIVNLQHPVQDATLQQTGVVVGVHQDGSGNQKWEIVVVGGNHITLKNFATGTYATGRYEYPNAPVIGSPSPYTWEQLSVPGGWYQIATVDGKFVWRLTSGEDNAPIVLQATPYSGQDSQFGYNPAP